MYVILGSGTAAKLALYYYCKQFKDSDSIAALAEDHYNDVLSNVAAIVTASIAAHIRKWWWVDPAGISAPPPFLAQPTPPPSNCLRLASCMLNQRHRFSSNKDVTPVQEILESKDKIITCSNSETKHQHGSSLKCLLIPLQVQL